MRLSFLEVILMLLAILATGKLLSQPAKCCHLSQDASFFKTHELAIHLQNSKRIPYELTLSIYKLESANGTSSVAKKYNNYFGIRQRHLNPDGSEYYTYRQFDSKEHCFIWWGGMVADRVYKECMDQEISLIVSCMAERYSEDYHWGDKVLEIINQIKRERQ